MSDSNPEKDPDNNAFESDEDARPESRIPEGLEAPAHTVETKRKRLGRGLDALFEDAENDTFVAGYEPQIAENSGGIKTLGLDQITPNPNQPRKEFSEERLEQLAASIKERGVLQPLIVRRKGDEDDQYELVAGERRWRASQMAQIHEVPVIVLDLDDQNMLEIAMVENLQREDLNPLDEAYGYKALMEQYGYNQEEIARRIGKSRPHITNTLRLVGLSPKVKSYLREGKLTAGHARVLLKIPDADNVAERIIAEDISVREVEKLASSGYAKPPAGPSAESTKTKTPKDPDTLALEEELTNLLGMNVKIDIGSSQSEGVIKIYYPSLEHLDNLLKRLSRVD